NGINEAAQVLRQRVNVLILSVIVVDEVVAEVEGLSYLLPQLFRIRLISGEERLDLYIARRILQKFIPCEPLSVLAAAHSAYKAERVAIQRAKQLDFPRVLKGVDDETTPRPTRGSFAPRLADCAYRQ